MQRALLSGAVSPTPALLSLATPGTNGAVVLICVTLSISEKGAGPRCDFYPILYIYFYFFFFRILVSQRSRSDPIKDFASVIYNNKIKLTFLRESTEKIQI